MMFKADFGFGSDAKSILDALGKSLAIIEFEPTGTIITANENFCKSLSEEFMLDCIASSSLA